MMKNEYKKLLMASLFLVMSLLAVAASVGLEDAQARASAFLLTHQARMAPGRYGAPLSLIHAEPSQVDPLAMDYYVFQAGDADGFVIVSGEDRGTDILGYGDRALDMNDLPCGLQWLLGYYKEQMEWLHSHPAAAVVAESSRAVNVEPLLTCNWSQGEPYNNQCPVYKNKHCVTGCIATAMAQVMYYWQYPDSMPDYPAYVTGNIEVSALPGAKLHWDDMLDGYYLFDGSYKMHRSEAQAEAIATLMRYCGQSTRMGYGVDESGASSWNQMSGMTDMGYSEGSRKKHRYSYSAEEWRSMMLAELQAGRPILYCGFGDAGGHAFVVDGYYGGLFHINWGWEGSANGYFAMDAFTAYGVYDFSSSQSMLVGVYPSNYRPPYDVEVDGICYRRDGNELTVTRKAERDNTYSGNVTVPSHVTVDGVDCVVTAIANSAFKNCKSLRTVALPETLKRIGKFAFKGCTALTSMTLPDKLESTDYAAFQDCSGLRSFKFGTGMKHISSYAFHYCNGIQQLDLSNRMESIDPDGFFYCRNLKNLTIDMTCIPDESFYYCPSLKTVTLGNHVTTIGTAAFADCSSLLDLTMGAKIDSIAPLAFDGCTALAAIKRLPVVPPYVPDVNSFSEVTYSRATLFVPESAWMDYFCCDVWTLFESQIIEPDALPGDANLDGAVNIADVNLVINDILSSAASNTCDVNGDGSVNIADVNYIISLILSAQ